MRLRGTSGPRHLPFIAITSVVMVAAAVTGGCFALTSGSSRPLAKEGHAGRPHVAGISAVATANAPTPGIHGGSTGSAGSSDIACPMIPATTDPTGDGAAIGSAAHLFTRTTADGVTIRTYRLPATGFCGCGPIPSPVASGTASTGSGTSTPAVLADRAVSIELSDDAAVGQGTLFEELSPSPTTANAATEFGQPVSDAFGVVEGAPVWWTALSVGPDVASVQMTFADGSTDQMVPVDGVVVLAHHIDAIVASSGAGPDTVRGTLRLLDSTGTVLTTVPVPSPTPTPAPAKVPGSPPMTGSSAAAAASSTPTPSSAPGTDGAVVACPDLTLPNASPPAVAETPSH